jgi:hypothetical protein
MPGRGNNKITDQFHDPVERFIPLILKLLVYLWLIYFFYQAIITFAGYQPGVVWPLMLSTFRMFTFLPIHEAGHLIFRWFGTTLMFLGGSFWQIMFPLLWFLIAQKQRSHVAPFPLFWVGENMMDVSLYIRDAPIRQLPLLGGHKVGHDWFNLLSMWNMLDSADILADLVFYLGIIICVGAIGAGIYLSFFTFFRTQNIVPVSNTEISPQTDVKDKLDRMLDEEENKIS